MKKPPLLFTSTYGLRELRRSPGVDICLNCPLPLAVCDESPQQMTPAYIRRIYAEEPVCLLACVIFYNVPLPVGEIIARQVLNPEDPGTIEGFRQAIRGLAGKEKNLPENACEPLENHHRKVRPSCTVHLGRPAPADGPGL